MFELLTKQQVDDSMTLVKVLFEVKYKRQLNYTIESMIRNELCSNAFDTEQLGNYIYIYMLFHGSDFDNNERIGMLAGSVVGAPLTEAQLNSHRTVNYNYQHYYY